MRRVRRSGVVIAAVALLVLGAGTSSAAAKTSSFFGLTGETELEDLEAMSGAGAGTFATLFHWRVVQPAGPEFFDWSATDALVAAASRADIEILAILYGTATHVGESAEAPLNTEAAREGWRNFVGAAVARYGRNGEFWNEVGSDVPYRPVRAWQIWQEPNQRFFFRPRPDPKLYGELVKLSAPAIRAADPKAKILAGGIPDVPKGSEAYVPMKRFLKGLYKVKGIKSHFDAISLHPYGGTVNDVKDRFLWARAAMRKGKDGKTPIWVTEIGWSSGKTPKHKLNVGPKMQAKRMRAAFKMLLAKKRKWRIKRVLWFNWKDHEVTHTCKWCGKAGLVDENDRPKRTLREFKRFARK